MLPAAAGIAAVGSLVAWLIASNAAFVPTACAGAEAYLAAGVVGQELAVGQLTDAVCAHLADPRPAKPLILSAHGPPGVGKTLSHQLLARALYNAAPERAGECPGRGCRGYKVFYGMDYLVAERSARLAALRDGLASHLRGHPEALVVVEEYDKLDCDARGLWRQVLQHPERLNASWGRAIVLLESNLGMSELEQLLTAAGGDRSKVGAEAADAALRGLVFDRWQASGCEGYEDTLKFVGLVSIFLPFLPLGRPHVEELARRALAARAGGLAREKGLALEWGPPVVDFLVSRVEFSGPYPMEGAKGVDTVVTRYVARLLRHAPDARPGRGKQGGGGGGGGAGAAAGGAAPALVVSVAPGGGGLAARVEQRLAGG